MYHFHHAAMASQFVIRCTHPDENYAGQAARFAFDAVDRLEQQLSRFVENSDVSGINHLSAGEGTKVGYETMQCLQLARRMYEETEGAFDPSVGTGFDSLELIPGEFVVRARALDGDDGAGRTVHLDLGAIGKGYAVDRIADVLADWDVTRALIDAGYSSVLALDPPADSEGWPLTLTAPGENGRVFERIHARQRALGASGIRKGDHILDPRDRTAVRARSGAWVSAPREALADICRQAGVEVSPAAVADALSTAFMIMPLDAIERYCQRHAGVEAWVTGSGRISFFSHTGWLMNYPPRVEPFTTDRGPLRPGGGG